MISSLDNPIYAALTTADASKNIGSSGVTFLDPEIAPFIGLQSWDEQHQRMLINFAPANRAWFLLIRDKVNFIDELEVSSAIPLFQFHCPTNKVDNAVLKDDSIIPLNTSHVDEMLALTTLTKPGPFRSRTIEFGNYHGIFEDGKLVAMGGERLHLDGYTEVSAICTHPGYQGRGFGARIVKFLTNDIRRKGQIPFLHSRVNNPAAIEVYKKNGYEVRADIWFYIFRSSRS